MKKYRVQLTEEEQQELRALVSKGRAAAYKQTHARILLLSNEGHGGGAMQDEEIGRSLAHFKQVGTATVERVRRRCVEAGVAAALGRKEQLNRRQKKLDGQGEAHPVSSTGQALLPRPAASFAQQALAETGRRGWAQGELWPWCPTGPNGFRGSETFIVRAARGFWTFPMPRSRWRTWVGAHLGKRLRWLMNGNGSRFAASKRRGPAGYCRT